MCKLYIETSDLDNAVSRVDKLKLMNDGSAVLKLKSDKLTQLVQTSLAGYDFVSLKQHTKFSIVAGIVIGLELARTQLNLDVRFDGADDLVSAYDLGDGGTVI